MSAMVTAKESTNMGDWHRVARSATDRDGELVWGSSRHNDWWNDEVNPDTISSSPSGVDRAIRLRYETAEDVIDQETHAIPSGSECSVSLAETDAEDSPGSHVSEATRTQGHLLDGQVELTLRSVSVVVPKGVSAVLSVRP